jgi:hypothetical protein
MMAGRLVGVLRDPAPSEQPTEAPVGGGGGPGKRVVAYVENWKACPTDRQMEHVTHVLVAFAVSYRWSAAKNQCSDTCHIGLGADTPICGNAPNAALVNKWKAQGKKIILSFGGAGMGGSWASDVNDCWEQCIDAGVPNVASQLEAIIAKQGFDGIDIDYEYHVNLPRYVDFLKGLTTTLKSNIPGLLVTHAPMEPDMDSPNDPYFQLLKEVASSVDFIMIQYYNGYKRVATDGDAGLAGALAHYDQVVNDVFSGDASKVMFGFCISDCSSFNVDGARALHVVEQLTANHPNTGGAFYWAASHDASGAWSRGLGAYLASERGDDAGGAGGVEG